MTPEEKLEFEQLKRQVAALTRGDSRYINLTGYVTHPVNGKLGLFGMTPISQRLATTISAANNDYSTAFFADATYGNNELNMLNHMFQAMIGYGLLKEDAS